MLTDRHVRQLAGISAWLYGTSSNNGTLLGIGERSGNTPIEALVFWLIGLTGETHGMDTTVISEIASSSVSFCVVIRKWRIFRKASRNARSTDDLP